MKANETIVYVGRWDLLPEEWEGINGLNEATKEEIVAEVERQHSILAPSRPHSQDECDYVGVYTLEEFEAEFNYDLQGFFKTDLYWIKFIVAGKPLDL